jgi:aspartate/methionine/tyrosine aminotransferase
MSLPLARRLDHIEPFRVVQILERAGELNADGGPRVITLCVGEPDQGTPPKVLEAGRRALDNADLRYTNVLGTAALRTALSEMYSSRYGADVAPGRIIVTAGASGALTVACATLLDRGDELLLSDPGYPCNRTFAAVAGADVRGIPVDADSNFQLTPTSVAAHWGDATRMVMCASPSNPTGTIATSDDLVGIVDVARSRGGIAIVDEIYAELVYDRTPTSVLARTGDAVIVNSFSKTWGMTGWRLGWMVVPDELVEPIQRLGGNLFISPSAPAQAAALACFDSWDDVEARRHEFAARRDVLIDGLRSIGFGIPVVPEGAFYVYADCSAFTDDSYRFTFEVLERARVAITPGIDFGRHHANQFVRFAYTNSLDNINQALERLALMLRQ